MKNPPVKTGNAGNMSSIPGLGRSPEEGNGNPLQYSCLENSMDRGSWRATVHGVSAALILGCSAAPESRRVLRESEAGNAQKFSQKRGSYLQVGLR